MRRNMLRDYARGSWLASFATLTWLAACDGRTLDVGLTADAGVQGTSPGPSGGLPNLQATLISATTSVESQTPGGACSPWGQVEGLAFAPMTPALPAGATSAALTDSARRLAGTWIGHVTSPWANWDVAVAFSLPDSTYGGSYEAISNSATVPSFYYGSDLPCTMKKWQILGADTAGLEGDINVPYVIPAESPAELAEAGSDTNGVVDPVDGDASAEDATTAGGGASASLPGSCYLPGWQGQFHAMTFDTSGNRLRFTFGTGQSQGDYPISYDLWRVCGE
ncbi:MAG TPA: hypothetical protein VK762_32485 [Polyangiaceae bacterium]|jgi:hypothetical protein|nr:hypothetical protein [Polyangiaceae bacterium]